MALTPFLLNDNLRSRQYRVAVFESIGDPPIIPPGASGRRFKSTGDIFPALIYCFYYNFSEIGSGGAILVTPTFRLSLGDRTREIP
jgi:hypothetical protein